MNINDCYVNYIRYGKEKGKTIVLLHGWGQNIEMMKPIGDAFSNDFDIVIIDLPGGQGKSEEPKTVWTIKDYANMVHELLDSIGVKKPILMGHSFGGKVSLYYASIYNVSKLVLFAPPFRPAIKKTFKMKVLKSLKKVPGLRSLENFAKKHMGSTDYKNASPIMREILVSHVNLDISEDIKKIKAPTLIFWGTNDTAVPISEAYVLEELIDNAGVVEYPGTHYTYLEYLPGVVNVLKTFLKNNRED